MKIGPKESQRRSLREAHQVLGTENGTSGIRNAPPLSREAQFMSEVEEIETAEEALKRLRASRNARQQRYRNKRKAKGK